MLFCFLYAIRFQLGAFPYSRLWVGPPFHFRVGFCLLSRPPTTMIACGRVLLLVFLVLAPAFSFNSPYFVSPPRHADGTREGFDGSLSCHSTFFVSPPPPHRRYAPGFARAVCLIRVSAFPSIPFLRVFPGFIARPFRGVGVGFEDPHVRLMV